MNLPRFNSITKKSPSWLAQPVRIYDENIKDLRARLPEFEMRPFGIGTASNEYLVQVVRKPTPENNEYIPVGVVSRSYKLIQHTTLVDWLMAALDLNGSVNNECRGILILSS